MEPIADSKMHFAPFKRQAKAIQRLVHEGKYRNVTHFMRCAVEHYLDRIGCPSLSEQVRRMAEDFHAKEASRRDAPADLQDDSRATDEDW